MESIAGQHRLGLACSCKEDTVQVSQRLVGENMMSRHAFFCVFRAFNILNGYVESVQMEQARNSDSPTPKKKYNRTSGTDLS